MRPVNQECPRVEGVPSLFGLVFCSLSFFSSSSFLLLLVLLLLLLPRPLLLLLLFLLLLLPPLLPLPLLLLLLLLLSRSCVRPIVYLIRAEIDGGCCPYLVVGDGHTVCNCGRPCIAR